MPSKHPVPSMPARVFEIYADSRKIGIVTATDAQKALHAAYLATTRRTDSKMDESCDYSGLVVRELVGWPANMGELLSEETASVATSAT